MKLRTGKNGQNNSLIKRVIFCLLKKLYIEKFRKRLGKNNQSFRFIFRLFFLIYRRLGKNIDLINQSKFFNKIIKLSKFEKKIRFKKKKKNRSKIGNYLKITFGLALIFTLSLSLFFYLTVLKDLPNPEELSTREQILSTKIYARDGTLLYKIYRNQNRSLIKLQELPSYVVNAMISAEDKEFWTHHGFSLSGIIRAFNKNLQEEGYYQGGSTITQQLIKNSLLSHEKTIVRKIKELVLSIEVEILFTKEEILQMYLNEIPYGGVNYGIYEASQSYFGKDPKDLNLAEAALLAGIPSSPTKYSPYGAHPEYAVYRQRYVLDRMVEDGYISLEEANLAKNEKLMIKNQSDGILAPHFVMFVKNILEEKYGARMVEEGGLKVITSLDPNIQKLAEESVTEEINKLFEMNVTNGAVLVSKPATGEVVAMVGSRNYFDNNRDGNVNLTTSLRQPGSSIKPVVYALALENGMKPSSTIEDTPVSYPDGEKRYTPVNYDGRFHGIVNLRTALASSFNIPAVKLTDKLGVANVINMGERLGVKTWGDRSRFGLSIALGGGEVRMVDMAVVYGSFANSGLTVELNPILQVQDTKGKVLSEFYCNKGKDFIKEVKGGNVFCRPKTTLSPIVAWQISDMLSDTKARVPGFGNYSLLNIKDRQVAVKTGTTNDKRDNWVIGYTPNYVTVVWVGNNDNSPMSAVASGVTGATPIWNNIMTALTANDPEKVFEVPKGLIAVDICADNGYLPCQGCKQIKTEYFIPGTEPRFHCVEPTPTPGN